MNNIIKCITEIFCAESSGPVGLCSFEHSNETEIYTPAEPKKKREMRLSELME